MFDNQVIAKEAQKKKFYFQIIVSGQLAYYSLLNDISYIDHTNYKKDF